MHLINQYWVYKHKNKIIHITRNDIDHHTTTDPQPSLQQLHFQIPVEFWQIQSVSFPQIQVHASLIQVAANLSMIIDPAYRKERHQ